MPPAKRDPAFFTLTPPLSPALGWASATLPNGGYKKQEQFLRKSSRITDGYSANAFHDANISKHPSRQEDVACYRLSYYAGHQRIEARQARTL